MSIENPAPAHPPQSGSEDRSTARSGPGNTRRSAAVPPGGDRIAVQRVTQTVAGEYREWTLTVRQSSPADRPEGELTRVGAVALLPTPVRDWLSAWLEGRMVHAGEHILRPRDGAPLLVGRDFVVGDRVRGEERAPLFPIEGRSGFHTDQVATYAGRTAPRRTRPPEVPIRLWNAAYTAHHDTVGRADDEGPNVWRVRPEKAEAARAWIQDQRDAYGDEANLHVAVLDRVWSVRGWSFWDHTGLILRLEPLPKPPRVDEALGRRPARHAGPPNVVGAPAHPKTAPPADAPYAGPFPPLVKGDRIGVEHPDTGEVTTHEFSGDPANLVADEKGRLTRMAGAVDKMRAALREDFPDVNYTAPAPEAYKLPDGVGLGTVPEYGEPVADEKPTALFQPKAQPEFVGTVTSGLIHATPERHCSVEHDGFVCCMTAGHTGDHVATGPDTVYATWAPEPDVDEVVPMPGGPNDRLSHATIPRHPDQAAPGALHFQTGKPFTGYADLYARLDDIHDATADQEDDQ